MPMHRSLAKPLFNSLETAVVVVSAQMVCDGINEAAERLLCTSQRRAEGQGLVELFPANEDLIAHCAHSLALEVKLVARDVAIHIPLWQRSTRVDYSIAPFELDGQTGLLLELHEVERRAQASENIKQAEQFDSAIAIVKGLSHEIKNPLAGIRGAAQLLQRSGLSPAYTEFTDIIVSEVDRLANFLNRMSTLNKAPHRALVDCHELLEHCASLAQTEFGESLQFQRDYDTSLPEIDVDSDQLIQVLLNIIKNAGQAMQGNGQIRLVTRVAYPDTSRHLMPGMGVQMIIADNGPGLSPAMRARAFLPLVTDKPGGTGLGLAIAQEIIHHHQGFIRADDVHTGAQFSLFLPLGQITAEEGSSTTAEATVI